VVPAERPVWLAVSFVVVVPVGDDGVAAIVVAPTQFVNEEDVDKQKLAVVLGSPFGFTVPFNVAVVFVSDVAGAVVTVGVAAVVKLSTLP
jgi:hypothetical protein